MAHERLTSDLSTCASWGVISPSSLNVENRAFKSYDDMETAQWVKGLPHKHEDLSSNLSSHIKSWTWRVLVCHPIHGKQR